MSVALDTKQVSFTVTVGLLKGFKQAVSGAGIRPAKYSSFPALTHALWNNGWLTVTDLDSTVRVHVGSTTAGDDDCSFLIPWDAIVSTVKGKASDKVTVSAVLDGELGADVTIGGATYRVRVPASEYPRVNIPTEPADMVRPSDLAAVLPAYSHDDARPILTGIYVDTHVIAACDSYRLEWLGSLDQPAEQRYLIPGRIVKGLLTAEKAFGKATTFTTWPADACWSGSGWQVATRQVCGEFPRFRSLVPSNLSDGWSIRCDAKQLAGALAECRRFIGKSSATPVRLQLTDSDTLTLLAYCQDIGEWSATIPATVRAGIGHAEHVGFNPEYLATACRGDGTVTIRGIDQLKPALCEVEGQESTRLLMPVIS